MVCKQGEAIKTTYGAYSALLKIFNAWNIHLLKLTPITMWNFNFLHFPIVSWYFNRFIQFFLLYTSALKSKKYLYFTLYPNLHGLWNIIVTVTVLNLCKFSVKKIPSLLAKVFIVHIKSTKYVSTNPFTSTITIPLAGSDQIFLFKYQ